MIIHRAIPIILALMLPLFPKAQDAGGTFHGFSGGMMLHSGYLAGASNMAPVSVQGLSNGVGGALRVNLTTHLRVGMEGYVSTLNASSSNARDILADGSYIRTGLGGVLLDICWRKGKLWPYLGVGLGGGAMRGLYILEGNQSDWLPEAQALLNKQPFFYTSPFVGTDFCITTKVHLTLKADWLLALSRGGNLLRPTGPRLYLGFMFCH